MEGLDSLVPKDVGEVKTTPPKLRRKGKTARSTAKGKAAARHKPTTPITSKASLSNDSDSDSHSSSDGGSSSTSSNSKSSVDSLSFFFSAQTRAKSLPKSSVPTAKVKEESQSPSLKNSQGQFHLGKTTSNRGSHRAVTPLNQDSDVEIIEDWKDFADEGPKLEVPRTKQLEGESRLANDENNFPGEIYDFIPARVLSHFKYS